MTSRDRGGKHGHEVGTSGHGRGSEEVETMGYVDEIRTERVVACVEKTWMGTTSNMKAARMNAASDTTHHVWYSC